MALTKDNILDELKKQGTLTALLSVEEFAEQDKLADQLAAEFRTSLKPTQLRKIFHAIKAIERRFKGEDDSKRFDPQDKVEVRLLVPELAYARGRDLIPQKFYELMRQCLSEQKLQSLGDFRRLAQLLTALLAYHKYHDKVKGGREQ
ncbi:MAG: type III-A CRISPR-associated protein Csm2 [Proteobacteria bacterium]|nr:type III-A CRISPR-associated protein Csm2 [Pseudomonadota bacterium]